jgi:site-specific recombinase XerC
MDSLSIGGLIVVDRGRLGVDIVTKRDKKMKVFINEKGAEALKKWLLKREKEARAS